MQDWKQGEIGKGGSSVHTSLEAEQHRRERVLDIRQALAREVTERSKQVAGRHWNAVHPTHVSSSNERI